MKRLLCLGLAALLALTLAACTAPPESPVTPEAASTADTAATAETALPPVAGALYTVADGQGFNAFFNTGDGLYELLRGQGYCLVVRTDYATATRQVVCSVPGCTHDTDACPAWLPGQLWYYSLFAAGDAVYVYKYRTDGEDQSWEEFYQSNVAPYLENVASLQGMTPEEFERLQRAMFDQRKLPACLFVIGKDGTSRRQVNLSENLGSDVELRWCDGTCLYGYQGEMNTSKPSTGYRVSLADGKVTCFPMQPGEIIMAAQNTQLLTTRLLTSVPIPAPETDGGEAYQAAVQNGTMECCWLDPATGTRTRLLELPGKLFEEGGDFRGMRNGTLYFQEAQTQTDGSFRYTALRAFDTGTGQWRDVLQPMPPSIWSEDPTVIGLPGIAAQKGNYLWFSTAGLVTSRVLDLQTGQMYEPALKITTMDLQLETKCLSLTDDGRFLLCVGQRYDGYHTTYQYGLIDAEAFLQGSTDYTPVTGPDL